MKTVIMSMMEVMGLEDFVAVNVQKHLVQKIKEKKLVIKLVELYYLVLKENPDMKKV